MKQIVFVILSLIALLLSVVNAHMSIFVPSMWGQEPSNINSNWACQPLEDQDFSGWVYILSLYLFISLSLYLFIFFSLFGCFLGEN